MSVVLLCEDDDDIAAVLSRLFRRAGMTVSRAEDGASALRMAVAEPPDVIVTDLGMPRMDGWELIEAVRGHEVLADTPVLILSGHLCHHDPRVADSGACAVLLKPCPNERILATVEHLLAWGPHRHGAGIAACPLRASEAVPASEAVVR